MNTTYQSDQEENANQQGETEDDMGNTDLEDSAVGWEMEALAYYDLPIQV